MELTERLRTLLSDQRVTEKRMFGGDCFLYQGNMLCGVTNKGQFMARMGKEREQIARDTLLGAQDMDYTGKKLGGMLFVEHAAIESNEALQRWLDLCVAFASTLPAK